MADVKKLIRCHERLKSERSTWESHWEDVARFFRPEIEFTAKSAPGSERRVQIYDDTGPQAAIETAGFLDGSLTNTSIRWFGLLPADPAIPLTDELSQWLYDTTTAMLRWFDSPDSGFAVAQHELYLDYVTFGTAVKLKREDAGKLVRFQAMPLSAMYLDQDDDGSVCCVNREFELDAEEMVDRFGENVHPRVSEAYARDNFDTKFTVVHVSSRRSEYDGTKADPLNMPWLSCYIDTTNQHVMREGGFHRCPYTTPRWEKVSGEVYGRSPAMRTLPSTKALNVLSRTTLEATELGVRPPMFVPANGIEGSINTRPGGITYTRAGTRDFPQPMQTGANPGLGENEIIRRGEAIRRAFYTDLFRLPESDRMTATEIVARQQYGLSTISPVLGRLYSEDLNETVLAVYRSFQRNGKLPPGAPRSDQLAVVYTSPLAGSRGQSQAQAITDTLNIVLPLEQVRPGSMDNIDLDYAMRQIAMYKNADPKILRGQRQVAQIRQQQAQQAQQAQQLAMAGAGASALKDASSAIRGINAR